ncbi:MAG: NAD-dependent epimerase/dehydratase family protein [Rhodospirillales bacterium]|jgi:GDP-L-fucose synthase|nr:NAD-dependent epimerase/dehydratase family protein [Rhodospirillales bacterium]
MLDGSKILVAGGSGFIGQNLVRRLSADGHSVRATFNSHRPHDPPKGVEFIQADLRNSAECEKAVAGMDIVFMCAAVTSGAAVIRGTPLAHVTPNVVMNTQILEAAHRASIQRFVFLSTGCVYPQGGDHEFCESEVLDGPPPDCYFAAGWMKRYGEILCRTYAEKVSHGMNCTVVRPANIYGPGDKFNFQTSHVTAALIRKVLERKVPVEVWGNGEDIRDVIYIDDFIDGLIAAARHPASYFEVNIASGRGYSVDEILRTAIEVDRFTDVDIRFCPDKPSTVSSLRFDTTIAKRELGFEARVSLDDGIGRTLAWLRRTPKAVWDR